MFARNVLVGLCLTAFACGGSATAPPSPTPAQSTFTLTGRVADADTNTVLAGATVTILDGKDANRSTVTDASGSFRLAGLSLGGFTVRVRNDGYDSAFQGVHLDSDMSIAVQLKVARRTLAGTWTGTLALTTTTAGRQDFTVSQVPMMQDGNTVSATFQTSGPYQGSFSGTLRDASALGSSTEISGRLTLTETLISREITSCTGATDFSGGTVSWTQLSIGVLQIVFTCNPTFSTVAPATSITISFVRQQ